MPLIRSALLVLLSLMLFAASALAVEHVESTRYGWVEPDADGKMSPSQRPIFSGQSTLLKAVELTATTVEPRKAAYAARILADTEQLILVKTGELTVTLGEEVHTIGPGSVALILPEDMHMLVNTADLPVTYYTLSYQSKAPTDLERGKAAGASFVIDFEDLKFEPHGRGGLRNYFNRATAMTENFEMHVTTLNEDITSHPPHTHTSEEIILMIDGEAEELINGAPHALATGDLVFLDSMVPHGIRNAGQGTCMYFAFQWR